MDNQVSTISAAIEQVAREGLKIQELGHDTLIAALIGSLATLFAAFMGIRTTFKQIARQFEHKIAYEGWQDLQQKLFDFQNALTDYDSTIQWLSYFITSQNNPLVNGGNKAKHRQEKWNEIFDTYQKLQQAYIAFLRSFENHEVIFLPLRKMKHEFQVEYRKRTEDQNQNFMEKLFPEMYGMTVNLSDKQLKKATEEYWLKLTEISAFLDDFRIELQNLTVGKILGIKVPHRVIEKGKGYKILTRKGFIVQK